MGKSLCGYRSGNLKIGIIGLLGSDQINDILASHVKDYVLLMSFQQSKIRKNSQK